MEKYIYTIPAEDADSSYLYYEARNAQTGEIVVSFSTNRRREGSFWFSEREGTYTQTAGTCQFSMPRDRDAARAKLRRMANQN